MNFSPNIQELFHDALEEPKSTTQILRIFAPFGKLPLTYLDTLLLNTQYRSLYELQLCIESTLRPCLLDINDDVNLHQKLASLAQKWLVSRLSLRFFFLRPNVQVGICRQPFRNFVEKDLAKAMQALREHTIELSEILGEESILNRPSTSNIVSYSSSGYIPDPRDLDDEML